jgi:malate synthase
MIPLPIMTNLEQRNQKLQEKRKNTPWREFVKEIGSRLPIFLYKNNKMISRYPATERI